MGKRILGKEVKDEDEDKDQQENSDKSGNDSDDSHRHRTFTTAVYCEVSGCIHTSGCMKGHEQELLCAW